MTENNTGDFIYVPFSLGQFVFYTYSPKTIYAGVIKAITIRENSITFLVVSNDEKRGSKVYYPPVHIDKSLKPVNLYGCASDAIDRCLCWAKELGLDYIINDVEIKG